MLTQQECSKKIYITVNVIISLLSLLLPSIWCSCWVKT